MGRGLLRAHRISGTRSDGMHLKIPKMYGKLKEMKGLKMNALDYFLLQDLLRS